MTERNVYILLNKLCDEYPPCQLGLHWPYPLIVNKNPPSPHKERKKRTVPDYNAKLNLVMRIQDGAIEVWSDLFTASTPRSTLSGGTC